MITNRPAAGPLTCSGEPAIVATTRPPIIPVMSPAAGGAPDALEVGDRAEAILRGVDALGAGDALLICGKGHETGQIVGTDVLPFDDVEQASMAVAALDGRLV